MFLAVLAACERDASRSSTDEPNCEDVVAHSDKLAIEWAARTSEAKGDAMREVIDQERGRSGDDPAVTLCEERLTVEQKRCVMAAEDLLEKNECLGE